MPSTYTTNLGIEKIAPGDQSGTWGVTTNTNFDILDQGINGIVQITLASAGSSGSPTALPITDGAVSNGRNKFIEFVDGGDLGGTAYVQLTPNDAEKIVFIRNSLSGGRSLILFQGTYNASNDFEVPNGKDVVLKFDGAGASATVTDVFVDFRATAITTPSLTATTANIDGGDIAAAVTVNKSPTVTLTGAVTGSGTLTNLGNASITTTATSDPTLTLSGDATGSATFTNLGNATLAVTVIGGDVDTATSATSASKWSTPRTVSLTGAVTGSASVDGSANVSIATTATSDPTLTLSGDVTGSATFTNLGNATLTATVVDDSHNHIISNVDGLQTALDGKLGSTANAVSASKWATARTVSLTGAVTGSASVDGSANVSIATTATSDPTLTLAGDATGSATFTNLGNATLTVTVVDDSHNHVISNVDGLQTALDGKLSTTGKAADSNLLDGIDSSSFLRSDTSDTMSGNLTVTGNVTAAAFFYSSDARLKENVETISSPLDTLSKLRGVEYDWKGSKKHSIGLIAQEVEAVLPYLVSEESNTNTKAVNYGHLVGLLIEGVKEQQKQINELQELVKKLLAR